MSDAEPSSTYEPNPSEAAQLLASTDSTGPNQEATGVLRWLIVELGETLNKASNLAQQLGRPPSERGSE